MKNRYKYVLLLLIISFILPSICAQYQQENRKVLNGFSGGMMLHIGYQQGNIKEIAYKIKGVTMGIGGAINIHLGNHCMIGSEGYVSTIKQNRNGSYIKHGWGGILGKFYWTFKHVMPYAGITIGGGSQTCLLMFDNNSNTWQSKKDVIFHKQTFMAVTPFLGCDFLVSRALHLTFKVDCLNSFTRNGLLYPIGPRVYFGIIFYR